MSDQTQQQPDQQPSTQTPASNDSSLATPKWNPWEGTPDPANDVVADGDADVQQDPGSQQPASVQGAASTVTQPAGAAGAPPQTPPQTPPPGPSGLTPEDISQLVARTVASIPQAPPPQAPFTEEDFVRTFQVFQPTPEILAGIGLPATPESVRAFNDISTAIVRQAVTMSAFQLEKLKQELTSNFSQQLSSLEPAKQMAIERQTEIMKERFFKAYPDLKGFDPLLIEIRDRLLSQGTRFKTEEEAFKTVADHARAIVKQIPGLSNSQQTQQQSTPTTNGGSRMSALSGAGQGGASAGSNSQGRKKTTAEILFG